MNSEEAIINGQTWIMTDIPAPDYSKTVFRPHPFKFTYAYESKTNDTRRTSRETSTGDSVAPPHPCSRDMCCNPRHIAK